VYHEHNRDLQDTFGTRALADRPVERLTRAQFIESLPFFFLATADAQGRPDCSFKGGAHGFVRIKAPTRLVFPDYDGNGMFKSLGNIRANDLPCSGLRSAPRACRLFRVGRSPRPAAWSRR